MTPYGPQHFAPMPSRSILFLRTFFLWQLVRFVVINVLMIRMIGKSHSAPRTPGAPGAPAAQPDLVPR